MSNSFHFVGRLAEAPAMTGSGDTARTRFTLISNEYAGKDDSTQESLERVVRIPVTAFGKKAEAIVKNCCKGDQLIVHLSISNNDWEDKDQVKHYDYNFRLVEFVFGAPGSAKREQLAQRSQAQNPAHF